MNELAVGKFSFFQIFRLSFTGCPSITSVCTFSSSFSFYSFWEDNQTNPANLIIIIIIININATTGQKSTFLFFQASDYLTQNPIGSIFSDIKLYEKSPFYFKRLLTEVMFFD